MKYGLRGIDCTDCGSFKDKGFKVAVQCKVSIYSYCQWCHCCNEKGYENCRKCNITYYKTQILRNGSAVLAKWVIVMINCPNCGEITKDNVMVYDESLRKQNIGISPILPTCKLCGSEVVVSHICNGGNIIVLNGTCGSGKTTIAELLIDKGWIAIDGDCAIQSLRRKKGTKQYEWNELINEIACEIDIISFFCKNIVLSHIILPEDLKKIIKLFESRNLKYKLILLKPEYEIAVERCQMRTCHTSITPEKWIKHFYDILAFDDEHFKIINNSDMTAQYTVKTILNLLMEDKK